MRTIQANGGPPLAHQRLTFGGRSLPDEATLDSLGMDNNSVIRLGGRLRAGGPKQARDGTGARCPRSVQ
eukprot:12218805-Heterocapsa_arctica.AAC.1